LHKKETDLLPLKRELAEEEARRFSVERKLKARRPGAGQEEEARRRPGGQEEARRLSEKAEKLKEKQKQLSKLLRSQHTALSRIHEEGSPAAVEIQERLHDEEARRKQAEDNVQVREEKLEKLQQLIADEITARESMQVLGGGGEQFAEKERMLEDAQTKRQRYECLRAVSVKIIWKEREVRDLQQQLVDTLVRKREAQYQNIEQLRAIHDKDRRAIHDKDRQVTELQAELAAEHRRMAMVQAVHHHSGGGPQCKETPTSRGVASEVHGTGKLALSQALSSLPPMSRLILSRIILSRAPLP